MLPYYEYILSTEFLSSYLWGVDIIVIPSITFCMQYLEPLEHCRDVSSLCVFHRLFKGECFEELFEKIPPSTFSEHNTSAQKWVHSLPPGWLSILDHPVYKILLSAHVQIMGLRINRVTYLHFPWCCKWPWAAVISQHEVNHITTYLRSLQKPYENGISYS